MAMTEPRTNVRVQLTGEDGNIFSIVGRTVNALGRAGEPGLGVELRDRVFAAQSYDEALQIVMEYVEVS